MIPMLATKKSQCALSAAHWDFSLGEDRQLQAKGVMFAPFKSLYDWEPSGNLDMSFGHACFACFVFWAVCLALSTVLRSGIVNSISLF